ncbi:MAG: DUF4405 domain-containing protein [Arcobacteraceae bacterium]
MNKRRFREIATSLTTIIFLVIGLTGVMLYFHWFNSIIKELHKILGLLFVAATLLHVFVNWNSMKTYFSKKVFFLSTVIIVAISSTFIIYSLTSTKIHPKKIVINSVMQAPILDSLEILNIDYEEAKIKLQHQSIDITVYKNINQLAKKNNLEPLDVITILKSE